MINDRKVILLVEDNSVTSLTTKSMLQKYNYNVITASSGEEAVEVAADNNLIDLILMDIDLGDGIDGTHAAKYILEKREIPIVFLSSHAESEIVAKTEKITSYGYVVKNTGITILNASIKMAFKLYNARIDLKEKNRELYIANEELRVAVEKFEIANENLKKSENEIMAREKKLAASEERYRSLMQNLPVGVFSINLLNPEKFVDANYALARINNSNVDDIIDRPVSSFFYDPEQMRSMLSYLQKNRIIRDKLVRLKRTDNKTAWGSITAECHYNLSDKPDWVQGIIMDVSEKIDFEEKLSEYIYFIETLINTISSPVFYKDTRGVYIGCNQAFAEMIIGLPRDKIINKTIFELEEAIPHELALKYAAKDKELLDHPGIQVYESQVNCADGKSRFFHFDKTTFNDPEMKIAGIVGVMVDITERVINENELNRINTEFSVLINSMASIIIGVSVDDKITHWNPFAEQIFGIQSIEIINKKFCECKINWDWVIVYEAISKCIIDDLIIRLDDMLFIKPDGKKGILGLTINPLKKNNDTLEGFMIIGKDLTNQRMMEQQLLQGKKLEAIGQLAAGVAHEINTPLQYVGTNLEFLNSTFVGVLGILDIYLSADVNKENPEKLFQIFKQAGELADKINLDFIIEEMPKAINQSLEGVTKVSSIVQSMKAFSHPGRGTKIPANINQAIENTVTVSRNEWKYDCEVKLKLDYSLPEVPCFESEFNQVLLNLIINAADAIHDRKEKGLIEKGIITISSEKKGDKAVITVSDNGGGIPDDIKEKVFDPFFTTKEVSKGTGQGLPISFSIIREKHGGNLFFESEPGIGTSFIIELQLEEK